MKIILRKDVANVGRKNEVKDVSDGYAQNFLIGRGLAELATPEKIKKAEKAAAHKQAEHQAAQDALEDGLSKLQNEPLIIRATANEKEHLFEAVSAETIAAHLKDVVNVAVSSSAIVISEPIKTLGVHSVSIAVGNSHVPLKIDIQSK